MRGLVPGLVNSHDHLEMNLFPHLGNPPYSNFYSWAESIYKPKTTPVKEILQVPVEDRLWWGGYKNLISGVTTVVHHNPYYRKVFNRKFPVKVLKKYAWSHSIGHGKNLRKIYLKNRNKPFIIHAAEGNDSDSSSEIPALDKLGVLGPKTLKIWGSVGGR
jgi:hypothetical protein